MTEASRPSPTGYEVIITVTLPATVPTGRWSGRQVTRAEVDAMVASVVDEFGAPDDLEEMGIVVSTVVTDPPISETEPTRPSAEHELRTPGQYEAEEGDR